MDSISLFDLIHHSLCVSLTRQDIHAECEGCHSIDRNTLMDRQDISMETCNGLKHNRQDSRFIIHLNDESDRLSSGFFVKRKNIILIFIKGASTDSGLFCCILYCLRSA